MTADSTDSVRKPPQSLEAEAAVLGAMLLEPRTVPTVIALLRPENFYLQAHRRVYQAILRLFEQNSPTDIVTVTAELQRTKELDAVGGPAFLSALLDSVLTTANCEEHARIVLEKSIQRQLIQTATEIVQAGFDEERSAAELLEEAEQKIFEIREAGARKRFVKVKDLLMTEMERVYRAMEQRKLITGVETGFHELDEMTSGLQPGELVIVAGRPSMGKTAFALNVAVNAAARTGLPVAIFSLEMSTESLVQRLMCSEAGVSMKNLRAGRLTREEHSRLANVLGPLSEAQLYIDDSPGLSALDIRARARRLRSEVQLGLIVIDYLQLMESHQTNRRERNRQQEISEITRGLKAMAKELNLPVVVISQLSRAPETRGGERRPQLSDLRESGAIEQDADLVLMLYRAEFYNPDDESVRGQAEVMVAKQRNGPLGTVRLTYLGHCMRFENPYVGRPPEQPEPSIDYEDELPE